MHEMSLCLGMLDIIAEQQRSQGFEKVRRVFVEVGALGHVEPQALLFAFDAAALDTVAAGAELVIREIPGRAWCMDCSASVEVLRRGDGCPRCGAYTLIIEQGDELRLKELEVL